MIENAKRICVAICFGSSNNLTRLYVVDAHYNRLGNAILMSTKYHQLCTLSLETGCLYEWIQKIYSGGTPSDQGWSNKFYHCKNQYFGKSRGDRTPYTPLYPPMVLAFCSSAIWYLYINITGKSLGNSRKTVVAVLWRVFQ